MPYKFNPFTEKLDYYEQGGNTDHSLLSNLDFASSGHTGFVNTALSNLDSTAINTSLISDTDSTDNLGSSTIYWLNTYTDKLFLNATATLDGATAGIVSVTGKLRGMSDLKLPTAADASPVSGSSYWDEVNKRWYIYDAMTVSWKYVALGGHEVFNQSDHDALPNPHHSNANDPTADQKSALAGTDGTPSGTNKYVTNSDPRNTNARTPVSHDNAYHSAVYITAAGVTYANLNASGGVGTGANQVLPSTVFSGLSKITVSTTAPASPATGDLWVDTN